MVVFISFDRAQRDNVLQANRRARDLQVRSQHVCGPSVARNCNTLAIRVKFMKRVKAPNGLNIFHRQENVLTCGSGNGMAQEVSKCEDL